MMNLTRQEGMKILRYLVYDCYKSTTASYRHPKFFFLFFKSIQYFVYTMLYVYIIIKEAIRNI